MSVRIQNDQTAGIPSPEVNRAGGTTSLSSGNGKSTTAVGAGSGDHVQFSSAAENISAGVSAQNQQQAARVTQLSALYASGQYSVDSTKISRALVANATTATRVGRA
jgi:anti-sigma28 factor (negative regulator of flagellin synthesis)